MLYPAWFWLTLETYSSSLTPVSVRLTTYSTTHYRETYMEIKPSWPK